MDPVALVAGPSGMFNARRLRGPLCQMSCEGGEIEEGIDVERFAADIERGPTVECVKLVLRGITRGGSDW